MSNLISATLTPEAMKIYQEMKRGEKSRIISKLIVEGSSINKRLEDLTEGINDRNILIARVIWELRENPIYKSLLTDLNQLLLETIHYQYDL